MTKDELDAVSKKIIGAAYKVSNTLGSGFLEKVYENALAHQLKKDGIKIEQQKPIKVYYDNVVVSDYFADLIAEGSIIIELIRLLRPLCEAGGPMWGGGVQSIRWDVT